LLSAVKFSVVPLPSITPLIGERISNAFEKDVKEKIGLGPPAPQTTEPVNVSSHTCAEPTQVKRPTQ
jgi:hypothetical protein